MKIQWLIGQEIVQFPFGKEVTLQNDLLAVEIKDTHFQMKGARYLLAIEIWWIIANADVLANWLGNCVVAHWKGSQNNLLAVEMYWLIVKEMWWLIVKEDVVSHWSQRCGGSLSREMWCLIGHIEVVAHRQRKCGGSLVTEMWQLIGYRDTVANCQWTCGEAHW